MCTKRTSLGPSLMLLWGALGWGRWRRPYRPAARSAGAAESPERIPPAAPVFEGVIGRTIHESQPSFPEPIGAPQGAPTS